MIQTNHRKPSYRNHKLHSSMGSCCSSCAAHAAETGPPLGPPHTHTHGCGGCGGGSLGDVTCDDSGNCYDSSTGMYMPPVSLTLAQVQASTTQGDCLYGTNASGGCLSPVINAGVPIPNVTGFTPVSGVTSATQWLSSNSTMLAGLAAALAVVAFVTGGGGKRR